MIGLSSQSVFTGWSGLAWADVLDLDLRVRDLVAQEVRRRQEHEVNIWRRLQRLLSRR